MARRIKTLANQDGTGAGLGLEAPLWAAADKLRSSLDAAAYKHVVLGLIFLKHLSGAFEEAREAFSAAGADPDDPAAHRARGVFWVPPESRWPALRARAAEVPLGEIADAAMAALERENPALRGALPAGYGRLSLDRRRLDELFDLVSTMGGGDGQSRSRDVLGRVYEYFLAQFARAEGQRGGQFYTPRCVVRLLVEMLAPERGSVYDPCCGSGGMFVQSDRFVAARGGGAGPLRFYGQESNPTTWRLAKMNLALRGLEGNLGAGPGDSLHCDQHPGLLADTILANPPFNDSDWGGERLRDDPRWKFGAPPPGNANFAWVQHFIHHLAPQGRAGFVLANGSMSSSQSGEGEIRRSLIEADLVDCMVALPAQLFYSTQIPACVWILARDRQDRRFRDRRGEVLFIDARGMGALVDRIHVELRDEEIDRVAALYHAFRGDAGAPSHADVPGLCRAATLEEIRRHRHALVPGRYVGFDRGAGARWDRAELGRELLEIEARLEAVQASAAAAVRMLKELLDG